MLEKQEVFRVAYREWKESQKNYQAQIDAIIDGANPDWSEIQPLIDAMEIARKRFTEASSPFVGWKKSS